MKDPKKIENENPVSELTIQEKPENENPVSELTTQEKPENENLVTEEPSQGKFAKENNLLEVDQTVKDFENILQVKQNESFEQDTKPIDIKKDNKNLQKYQPVPLTALQGLATVLMIFGMILAGYTLFVSVSFIVLLGYYLILVLGVILTLFTLLLNEEYMALFQAGNEVADFLAKLSPSLPYTYGISFGLFLTSMILFGVSKKGKKRTMGMVFNGVFMGIEIVIGIIILIFLYGVAA